MKQIVEIAPLADYFVVAVKDKSTGALIESFTLNESAKDMLKLFCKGKSPETVAMEIADMYDAPIDLITKDVKKLTDKLRQKGII
jgi:hypothetical protein